MLNFAEIEESILSTDKIVSQRELRIRKLAVSQVHGVSRAATKRFNKMIAIDLEIWYLTKYLVSS